MCFKNKHAVQFVLADQANHPEIVEIVPKNSYYLKIDECDVITFVLEEFNKK
jgi:hypothetical protein